MNIHIKVAAQSIAAKLDWVPAADHAGIATYTAEFSEEWEGLAKQILWTNGETTVSTAVTMNMMHIGRIASNLNVGMTGRIFGMEIHADWLILLQLMTHAFVYSTPSALMPV